jgi:hypothetical protein
MPARYGNAIVRIILLVLEQPLLLGNSNCQLLGNRRVCLWGPRVKRKLYIDTKGTPDRGLQLLCYSIRRR